MTHDQVVALVLCSAIIFALGGVLGFALGHSAAEQRYIFDVKWWRDEHTATEKRCQGRLDGARAFIPAWAWERWYCKNVEYVKGRCERYGD